MSRIEELEEKARKQFKLSEELRYQSSRAYILGEKYRYEAQELRLKDLDICEECGGSGKIWGINCHECGGVGGHKREGDQ
jgi:DnaJ-class molecular chaperone